MTFFFFGLFRSEKVQKIIFHTHKDDFAIDVDLLKKHSEKIKQVGKSNHLNLEILNQSNFPFLMSISDKEKTNKVIKI